MSVGLFVRHSVRNALFSDVKKMQRMNKFNNNVNKANRPMMRPYDVCACACMRLGYWGQSCA